MPETRVSGKAFVKSIRQMRRLIFPFDIAIFEESRRLEKQMEDRESELERIAKESYR